MTTSLTDLMSWAKHTVSAAKDRSLQLVERIYKTDNDIEHCRTHELNCETWSQITVNTKDFDHGVFQGLHDIKWCRTQDLKSGVILEDRAFDDAMLDEKRPLGAEATDVKTTVYFGRKDTKATSRTKARKGLMKSIATCVAVFLLEASVFTSTGSESSTA